MKIEIRKGKGGRKRKNVEEMEKVKENSTEEEKRWRERKLKRNKTRHKVENKEKVKENKGKEEIKNKRRHETRN